MQVHAFLGMNIGAIFEAGPMASPTPLSNPVPLPHTVGAEDEKSLQRHQNFTGRQQTTPGNTSPSPFKSFTLQSPSIPRWEPPVQPSTQTPTLCLGYLRYSYAVLLPFKILPPGITA